jgi:hypothetical protein
MAKKTFMDNLDAAAANPALAFIGGGADTPQEPPKKTDAAPRTMPLERYDFHREEEERLRELEEEREKAKKLDEQLRAQQKRVKQIKDAAVKAANLAARRELTTRYRSPSDYANPRTKRVNLLIRPDLFVMVRSFCEAHHISINRLIEVACEEFIKQQRAAAEAEGDK